MDASENIKQHCMGSKYVIPIDRNSLFNIQNYMSVIQLAAMNNSLIKTLGVNRSNVYYREDYD